MFTKVLVILLLAHAYQAQKEYVPPVALVEPLCPNGFRISIPDESGIESVVYHIRINHEVVILESAHLIKNNSSEKHGRWTYQNKTIQLKKGDVIYYMVHVKNKGIGYNLADQEHVVTDFHDHGGNKIESSNICNITNAGEEIF